MDAMNQIRDMYGIGVTAGTRPFEFNGTGALKITTERGMGRRGKCSGARRVTLTTTPTSGQCRTSNATSEAEPSGMS